MSVALLGVLLASFCVSAAATNNQPMLNLKIFVQQQSPPSVLQMVEGKLENIQAGSMLIASSTLIEDAGYRIVVDTPTATDIQSKEKMLAGLVARNLIPGQIQMVVTTHGHPDHNGQLNFFPNARHFFGSYEYSNNNFIKTELNQAELMRLTQNVEIWNTPGHTAQDLSVIVRNVPCCGTVAVVGDLIYSEKDVSNYTEWYYDAWNPKIGLKNRNKVICCADWIVPGHGKMFRVTQTMRTMANCTGGYVPVTVAPTVPTTIRPKPTWTWTWTPTTSTTTTTVAPTTTTVRTTATEAPTTTTTVPSTTTTFKYSTVDYNWNNNINMHDNPVETTQAPTTTTRRPVQVLRPLPHSGISYVAARPTHLQYLAPCALATVHPCPPAYLAAPRSNQVLYPVLQHLVDAVPAQSEGYLQLIGKAFKKFAGDDLIPTEVSPKQGK